MAPIMLVIEPTLDQDWQTISVHRFAVRETQEQRSVDSGDEDESDDGFYMDFEDNQEEFSADLSLFRPPTPPPSLEERCSLYEAIPGFFIALAEDEADVRALRTLKGQPFTHLVHLTYITPIGMRTLYSEWSTGYIRLPFVRLVNFATPLSVPLHETALRPSGFRVARDFLSRAFPHHNASWWSAMQRERGRAEELNEEYAKCDPGFDDQADEYMEEARVLVVAPSFRAVDVLAILLCHLAYAAGVAPGAFTVEHPAWECVTLTPEAMEYVKSVADPRCETAI